MSHRGNVDLEVLAVSTIIFNEEVGDFLRELEPRCTVVDAKMAHELTLRGHSAIVDKTAVSPDGSRIATSDRDGVVKIQRADKGYHHLNRH